MSLMLVVALGHRYGVSVRVVDSIPCGMYCSSRELLMARVYPEQTTN